MVVTLPLEGLSTLDSFVPFDLLEGVASLSKTEGVFSFLGVSAFLRAWAFLERSNGLLTGLSIMATGLPTFLTAAFLLFEGEEAGEEVRRDDRLGASSCLRIARVFVWKGTSTMLLSHVLDCCNW